jgi:transposase
MFGVGVATKVFVAAGATDMRKGFQGLYGIVRDQLGCDPLSGHLFLFANAKRTRLKVLLWDGTGLWVCAKQFHPSDVDLSLGTPDYRKAVFVGLMRAVRTASR